MAEQNQPYAFSYLQEDHMPHTSLDLGDDNERRVTWLEINLRTRCSSMIFIIVL